jgi:D-alanyl-D-alanine carboxypeptidase
VNQYQQNIKTPGLLAAVWSPEGSWVSATGVSDLATGAPVAADMQYKIGSQTKPFVATLILQLVGQGKVSLEDHIDRWVQGVPNGNQITIEELLDHTSGLGDTSIQGSSAVFDPSSPEYAKLEAGCTPAELLSSGLPPVAPPGTTWLYSNYGYDLLGRVAELATGQNLSALIRKRITAPLGLRRTYLPTSGDGLTSPYTHGYGLNPAQPAGPPFDFTSLSLSCVWAAGGMVSTLADMRRWSVALGTGKLLKPSVWAQAQRYQVYPAELLAGGAMTRGNLTDGLGVFQTGGFLGHQGNWLGYNSATYYSPTLHTTVAVADTGELAYYPGPTALAQALAMAAFGRPLSFLVSPSQVLAPFTPAETQQMQGGEPPP